MRIYKHEGRGHYIGSVIIVVARDARRARKMIRERLDAAGLKEEEIELESFPVTDEREILNHDGNY